MYSSNFITFLIVVTANCLVQCLNQPEVRIGQGALKGLYINTINNRKIASFEGIPYAKPPSGKHRFKAPIAAGLWYGKLNATREPPHCLQYNQFEELPSVSGSEDCLYINVYTPHLPDATDRHKGLDVFVFIHGGAFTIGKSTKFGPSILLDWDVLLVTFNYRVGPLGFLSTEDDIVPGNNGLKDQTLALKWVQENIKAFGGNPSSVTIVGVSAGAACCHYHMLSPLSKGLFKSAILMSGVTLNPWAVVENSNEKAKFIANELGCPTNDSLSIVKCLRNRPAAHIVGLSQKLLHWRFYPLVPYGPVIEPASSLDAFISEPPINIIMNKGAADVPTLVSLTSDEGLMYTIGFVNNNDMFTELMNRWDDVLPHMLEYNYTVLPEMRTQINAKIKEFYKIDGSSQGLNNFIKMFGDRLLVAGISKLAKTASLYTSPMYIYKFSYMGRNSFTPSVVDKKLGVSHADDIFTTIGIKGQIIDETDLQMNKKMLNYWVSFAANGTLGEGWQPVNETLPRIALMEIQGLDGTNQIFEDELGQETFWDSLGLNENIVLNENTIPKSN